MLRFFLNSFAFLGYSRDFSPLVAATPFGLSFTDSFQIIRCLDGSQFAWPARSSHALLSPALAISCGSPLGELDKNGAHCRWVRPICHLLFLIECTRFESYDIRILKSNTIEENGNGNPNASRTRYRHNQTHFFYLHKKSDARMQCSVPGSFVVVVVAKCDLNRPTYTLHMHTHTHTHAPYPMCIYLILQSMSQASFSCSSHINKFQWQLLIRVKCDF